MAIVTDQWWRGYALVQLVHPAIPIMLGSSGSRKAEIEVLICALTYVRRILQEFGPHYTELVQSVGSWESVNLQDSEFLLPCNLDLFIENRTVLYEREIDEFLNISPRGAVPLLQSHFLFFEKPLSEMVCSSTELNEILVTHIKFEELLGALRNIVQIVLEANMKDLEDI